MRNDDRRGVSCAVSAQQERERPDPGSVRLVRGANAVLIERLEVEEGFLGGLDLAFSDGLNVIIGSRGTGKTSIIELLRWTLGAESNSPNFKKRTQQHVSAILGGGEAVVTATINGTQVRFARTAQDASPRVSSPQVYMSPLILSQNEIETLGRQASGRLGLVDGFARDLDPKAELAHLASIGSTTATIAETSRRIAEMEAGVANVSDIDARLEEARAREGEFAESLQGLTQERARLDELQRAITSSEGFTTWCRDTGSLLGESSERLDNVAGALAARSNAPPDGVDLEQAVSSAVDDARANMQAARQRLEDAASLLNQSIADQNELRTAYEAEARELRRQLDEVSEGAGAAARNVAELETARARAIRATGQIAELRGQIDASVERRHEMLDQLERVRSARIASRQAVVTELNSEFGPSIEFSLVAYGNHAAYTQAIMDSLRGSGVHYNALAPEIASTVSPSELITFVEQFDVDGVAEALDISSDRAARLLSALVDGGLDQIATAEIDDRVEISLLDGSQYKSTSEMSTGQRCTAVLPVLLRHDDRVVVIDQPEDNLDTAYIVKTVVRAMTSRRPGSQLIVATHNPNIPVLGEATKVVQMRSDGKRGFKEVEGRLAEPDIIGAIVNVMEGGAEAFRRRSDFYRNSDE